MTSHFTRLGVGAACCLLLLACDGTASVGDAKDGGPDVGVTSDLESTDAPSPDSGQKDSTIATPDGPDPSYVAVVGDTEGWAWGGGLVLDAAGNAFVTGGFGGTVQFGSTTLKEAKTHTWPPESEVFVAKLDPNGKFVWATALATGASDGEGVGIDLDASGNIYVCGAVKGVAGFGSHNLSPTDYDGFLAKLDPAGNVLWAKLVATGSGPAVAFDTRADAAGNSYVTGRFTNTVSFGSASRVSAGKDDLYVASWTPAGDLRWVAQGGGDEGDAGGGLTLDSSGNVFVAGEFTDTAAFGTNKLTASVTSALVAKIDPSGKFLWASQGGGGGLAAANSVVVDKSGNVRIAGFFQKTAKFGTHAINGSGQVDGFAAGLDSLGKFIWAVHTGAGLVDDIAVDSSGDAYVAGRLSGKMTVGPKTLQSQGGNDVSVVKIDQNGNLLGGILAGGMGPDGAARVRLDGAGSAFLVGWIQTKGTVKMGTAAFTTTGNQELFVWRLPLSWI